MWRDSHTLQLGTDPARAAVLRFSRPELARVLDWLDGTYTETSLLETAGAVGIAGPEVLEVLAVLRAAGLLLSAHALVPASLPEGVRRRLRGEAAAIALSLRGETPTGPSAHASALTPADVLRRRATARVLVIGTGPLVAPVAAALAASGIGHIDPALDGLVRAADVLVGGLSAEDIRQPRAIGTATAVGRVAPGTVFSAVPPASATLVVQLGGRHPVALGRRGIRPRHVTRLEVHIRAGTVVVGPLVRPHASPCRACLELHRNDRDPAWPVLSAQLATAPDSDDEPCAHTTALAGAAYAADEVLAYVDGGDLRTEAAMVEITRPGEMKRRIWGPHPGCDCRRRRRGGMSG